MEMMMDMRVGNGENEGRNGLGTRVKLPIFHKISVC